MFLNEESGFTLIPNPAHVPVPVNFHDNAPSPGFALSPVTFRPAPQSVQMSMAVSTFHTTDRGIVSLYMPKVVEVALLTDELDDELEGTLELDDKTDEDELLEDDKLLTTLDEDDIKELIEEELLELLDKLDALETLEEDELDELLDTGASLDQ